MKKLLVILTIVLCAKDVKAQLQNMDFEQWEDNNGVTLPSSWIIGDNMGQFGISRDSLPQQGDYAMTLSRWYWYDYDDAVQQSAINFKPKKLSGYYKYTDNWLEAQDGDEPYADTAHVYVFATKWNAQTQLRDTLGRGHIKMFGTDFWTEFNCPLYYTGTDEPDSVTIRLTPTERNADGTMGLCSTQGFGWCSYFTVDNLMLTPLTTDINDAQVAVYSLYPNPANNRLFIATTPGNEVTGYTLCNAMGQVVAAQNQYTAADGIDLSALSVGVYYITLNSKGKLSTQKIIKQ